MKTFARLIRRYVLAAAGATFLLLAFGIGVLILSGNIAQHNNYISSQNSHKVAEALEQTDAGLTFSTQKSPAEWMQGYEWAMVLDDDGRVIWQYSLPAGLDRRYTPGDVASFARWFLDDYPVFCWSEDYGLFVIALPRGSLWRASLNMSIDSARAVFRFLSGLAVSLPLLAAALYIGISWRSTKALQSLSVGLETLAQGGTVQLPVQGFTGEVAEKLNQTSAQLQTRNDIIARRDAARTNWIAGVSHDIRTPLALILGWAEQLSCDDALPAAARQKASGICTQSEKIRALIEDLNLTSKLQYGAQPLRRQKTAAGPLLRNIVAAFCEEPLSERCTVDLSLTDEAERAVLDIDTALLSRAVENLLSNSVRHNAAPVHVTLTAELTDSAFLLTVADDGVGYPPAVLQALSGSEPATQPPHILGLHVVEQIMQAHGGRAVFAQNEPHGAKAGLSLPV